MDENTTTLEEIRSIDNAKEASTDLVALNNTVRTECFYFTVWSFQKEARGGEGGLVRGDNILSDCKVVRCFHSLL